MKRARGRWDDSDGEDEGGAPARGVSVSERGGAAAAHAGSPAAAARPPSQSAAPAPASAAASGSAAAHASASLAASGDAPGREPAPPSVAPGGVAPSAPPAPPDAPRVYLPPGVPASVLGTSALARGCRSVGTYRPLHVIDEGAYGKVWLAETRGASSGGGADSGGAGSPPLSSSSSPAPSALPAGTRVALKQVKFDKVHPSEGFPVTALREFGSLLAARREREAGGVVSLLEVVVGTTADKVYAAMEFLPHNLRDYIERLPPGCFFTPSEVKCLARQLLRAVAALHGAWTMHRDLKTANVLMDNAGRLVVCDFGLARRFGTPARPHTPHVVTLWYRAPEVLLGSTAYGPPVDAWAAGCILAELLTRAPLFQADSEAGAVQAIFRVLGVPTDAEWPGWRALPGVAATGATTRNHPAPPGLRRALRLPGGPGGPPAGAGGAGGSFLSEAGLDLLQGLLALNPERRLTADAALRHAWLTTEEPAPLDPRLMPAFPSSHDAAGAGGGGGPGAGGGGGAGGGARRG